MHRLSYLVVLLALASVAAEPLIPTPVWPAVVRQDPQRIADAIDRAIDAVLHEKKIPASPLADDAEFLRRVCLDLTGQIPTPERAQAFLDSTAPDKRVRLVDELLADPAYGKHFGNIWHDLIIPRTPVFSRINPPALRAAFTDCFNRNLPWSETVARLVRCDSVDAERNFLAFYRVNGDMGGKPMANVVARSFSRLFLGLRMECAECHDDPFKSWTQNDYWGLTAFFGRVTQDRDRDKENLRIVEGTGYSPPKGSDFRLTVRPDGALTIHKEAWKNVGQIRLPQVLGGQPLTFAANEPMLPTFLNWVTAPDNPYLARAAVNRTWAHLFARGLVHPLDDYDANEEGTHPKLLALLIEEFTRSHHDLKHLLRCLCNSRTYQRTSRPVAGNNKLEDPLFGRMAVKTLTAEMLLDSLAVASGSADLLPRTAPPPSRSRAPVFTRDHFIRLFNTNDVEGDPTDYNHGIPQLLHLMNTPLYNSGSVRIAKLLEARPTPEAAIETLYLATLSRRPTAEELKRKLALVNRHTNLAEGLNGVLWTLVNQSEFIVNH